MCNGCVCTQVYVCACASLLRINRQELQRQRHGQSIRWQQTEGGTAGADKKKPGRLKGQIGRTENE